MSTRNPFAALVVAAGGAHAADQIVMAALPLIAVFAFDAGPGLVGALVAAQGAAWLLASLPGGVLVDRVPRRWALAAGNALGTAGLCVATMAVFLGLPWLLGLGAFVATSGTVLFVLACNAAVPDLVATGQLPRANARIETMRGACMLLAPASVGFLAAHGLHAMAFAAGALATVLGVLAALMLPALPAPVATTRPKVLRAIVEGAGFVVRQPLLRAIALCAVFWNLAFYALLAIYVPYLANRVGLSAGSIGLVQAMTGAASLLAALTATYTLRVMQPRMVLALGPGASTAGMLLLALAATWPGSMTVPLLAQALFGFAPMLWLICQISVRQLVTPPDLLGRVGATMQVALYGVRPLGAVLGGAVGAAFGLDVALWLATALFALSTLVTMVSVLNRLTAMPARVAH